MKRDWVINLLRCLSMNGINVFLQKRDTFRSRSSSFPHSLAAVLKPTKPEPHTGLIDANACLNFVENQEEYFEIVELNKNRWVKLHDLKVLMVPFDLTNVPAAFSNTMRNVLYPLLDVCVAVYLDDILIYSDSKTDHLKHIRRDRVSSKPP